MSSDFGTGLAAGSATPVGIGVSDDRQAFTLTYADFQVEANNGDGSPSVSAARWEWFVLPVEETPQGDGYVISLSGFDRQMSVAVGVLVQGAAGSAGDPAVTVAG